MAAFIAAFIAASRIGEVYNLGGGKTQHGVSARSLSDLRGISGVPMKFEYVDKHRKDHICYYSDLAKMCAHYPSWGISVAIEEALRQIVEALRMRERAMERL